MVGRVWCDVSSRTSLAGLSVKGVGNAGAEESGPAIEKFEDDETVMSDGSALAIAGALCMKRKELNEAARVLGVDPAIFPVL